MKHPNAFAAVVAGGPAVILIWLLAQVGVDMPEPVATSVVAAVIAVALWLGPKTRG